MQRFLAILASLALLLILTTTTVSGAVGPPHLGFYVDGTAYRTVGTPTDLTGTGAPARSFDTLYALGGNGLLDVAGAAPGDTDYNGGRWMVFPVTWNVPPYQLFSEEDVLAAQARGDLTIASTPAREFVCPVIPAH
jgi:hypothetical protein